MPVLRARQCQRILQQLASVPSGASRSGSMYTFTLPCAKQSPVQPTRRYGQRVFPNHDRSTTTSISCLNFFVQIDGVVERAYFAVDTHAAKALSPKILEQFCVLAFAPAHHRCQHKRTTTLSRCQDLIGDLVGGLALDNATALGTVRRAHACKKQAKVVINLSYSTHRRARILGRRLLIDRDGRRKAVDQSRSGLSIWPKNWRA